MELSDSVQFLKGVGPYRAGLLKKLGIYSIRDLLFFMPRAYEDRKSLSYIGSLEPNKVQTFLGTLVSSGKVSTKRRKNIYEIILKDKTGYISAKWFRFNENYMKRFSQGDILLVSGNISYNRYTRRCEIYHPEIEQINSHRDDLKIHIGRIVPIYPTTEGLHQKAIRTIIKRAVDAFAAKLPGILPFSLIESEGLMETREAVKHTHFPDEDVKLSSLNSFSTPAQRTLLFEELLLLELGYAIKNSQAKAEKKLLRYIYKKEDVQGLIRSLPFRLTKAQRVCIKEIYEDLLSHYPMNRLLQGDVGSGKTVVAVLAMMLAISNGFQAALMAPTEVLARQHFFKISRLLAKQNVNTIILTGNTAQKDRDAALEEIKNKDADIVIGTHSLIQDDVKFNKLGLAVIDEQHKFGVVQRGIMKMKGYSPDILIMTATPIPRTLSMTVYGDLDLSVIDELPAGRKPVKTLVFYEKNRNKAYDLLKREIKKGRQGYIVFPLVDESDKLELKSAVKMMEHLKANTFHGLKLGLIHGRLKGEEKGMIMKRFSDGDIDILVSTTVIEVGVDVKNASVMLIEHAERFGLAQLHQLRGRVGRGRYDSYCVLLPAYPISEDARKRLDVIRRYSDGFMIAEKDLEIRGPGEFLGTKQSGVPELKMAHIIRDAKLLASARKAAFYIIKNDPFLQKEDNRCLKQAIKEKWDGKINFLEVG